MRRLRAPWAVAGTLMRVPGDKVNTHDGLIKLSQCWVCCVDNLNNFMAISGAAVMRDERAH